MRTTGQLCGRTAAVVAAALLATVASGQTIWHVNGASACPGNGSEAEPFCAIQPAIDAATHDDEIVVAPGTYNEAINLGNKAIHLRSSDGPEVTTIDATGLNTSVVACVGGGPSTMVEGFTITGGNADQGGGMRNLFCAPTVLNCIFTGNTATFGGAISNDSGSDATVINCQFIDNVASNVGGGIHNVSFSAPTVTDSTFAGNSAGSGGAIWSSPGTFCNTHVAGTIFCANGPDDIFGTWHDQGGNAFDPIADLNCDGIVNVSDLLLLLAAWGDCPDAGGGAGCPADLNEDGVVNVSDLLILLSNWG